MKSEKTQQKAPDAEDGSKDDKQPEDAKALQVGALVVAKNPGWTKAIVTAVHAGPKYDVEFQNGQV